MCHPTAPTDTTADASNPLDDDDDDVSVDGCIGGKMAAAKRLIYDQSLVRTQSEEEKEMLPQ